MAAAARVSGDRDRGGGPAGGMFRSFSSWFGSLQPAGGGLQSEGDEQPERDAPPEPHSAPLAESAEKELLHQAKGLGGECPPGPECVGSARNLRFDTPGARPNMVGVVGWGKEGMFVGRSSPLWTAEVGEELGKAKLHQAVRSRA